MNFSAASCGVSQEGEEKEAQQAARNCPTLLGLKVGGRESAYILPAFVFCRNHEAEESQ
jgi:hypothetical protein